MKGNVKMSQRKSVTSQLKREYVLMDSNLKARLGEVNLVSTTADISTANNKSFLGVRVHWISNSILESSKATMPCKTIRGRHRFDVIGTEIKQIHPSYGILGKVVATVTDNASNFAETFKI